MTARPQDGAVLHEHDVDWTYTVDHNEDGTSSWWTCGRCDGVVAGDDSRARHVCRTTCAGCDGRLVYRYDPPGWTPDGDTPAACPVTDNGEHFPEAES